MDPSKLAKSFRVKTPKRFRLLDWDPAETAGLEKVAAQALVDERLRRLAGLQERLYAQNSLVRSDCLAGCRRGGKDSAIKRVMSGLNPQGCIVHPFKAPTGEETQS